MQIGWNGNKYARIPIVSLYYVSKVMVKWPDQEKINLNMLNWAIALYKPIKSETNSSEYLCRLKWDIGI